MSTPREVRIKPPALGNFRIVKINVNESGKRTVLIKREKDAGSGSQQ